jgi:hypothetical protein
MATIVLGTVGRLIGGPIGGIIGATLGGVIDNSLFGGGPRGGRMSNLAVQSAAYGEPIPVITGRMRAAGNVLWSSGITESTEGGGKGQGSTYAYASSFAVGLAGRRIAGVGRIWADGKLIRDAGGDFLTPVTMRLHAGSEDQQADPVIAAFEGHGGAPAYRGIAYAVFEDLPLADYGNRIPNLTFEVIADAGNSHDAGQAIAALAMAEGRAIASVVGDYPTITGHFAGRGGSVADSLVPLFDITGAAVSADGDLRIRGGGLPVLFLPARDGHARPPGAERSRARRKLLGGETRVGAVELSFYDEGRDYQPGLQRARRDAAGAVDQRAIACAMTPVSAKSLATTLLARNEAARWQTSVRLPWRHLGLQPGDRLQLENEPGVWRVRQVRFEAFVVHVELERTDVGGAITAASDGGRVATFADGPAGPTTLAILDLPPLPGDIPAVPRLWVAAAGAAPGWRRATVEVSADAGVSFAPAGAIVGATPMGWARSLLPDGPPDRWDRHASVEIELLSDAMWLEGRPEASVLAGANLAIVGAEVVQFASADAVAPRRFRLSGLLRGRLGTEAAMAHHGSDDRFVLLDRASLLRFDPPADAVGRAYLFRPAGVDDLATPASGLVATGRALKPLSPVHLRLRQVGDDVLASWTRRSRGGFGWADFVDAPIAESIEAYRVDVTLDGRPARSVTVSTPQLLYSAADRAADGGGVRVGLSVAQLSAAVGPGGSAVALLDLNS